MKRVLAVLVLFSIALFACQPSKKESEEPVKKEGKGGRIYGGTFKMGLTETVTSLYPHSITDANSATAATQIYEGLVKFSTKDLSVVPSIAESWDVDTSGTIYTFHLKKGVMFHDDECFPDGKGREVKAKDVKYSLELLCTQSPENFMFASTLKDRVVGANEYYEASTSGQPSGKLKGVKVIDDYTVQITLVKSYSSFLYILTNPALSIIPKEAVDKYGTDLKVGTGPFRLVSKSSEDKTVLAKNNNYHGVDSLGNQLPFIDTIVISYFDSKKEELEAFKKEELDIVYGLPSESVSDIVQEQIASFQEQPPKYLLDRSPEMATNYYFFNMTEETFQNKKLRKAINYAIDRNKIVEDVLHNEAFGPGQHGIVPPAFKGYDVNKIEGYSYDPEKAKKLLAEAGYPNGDGLPTIKLELNSGGNKNTSVAFEIQKQMMNNLGINIDLEVVPFGQKLEDERFARADMFRTAWVADYPSPESFLLLFYGKNVPETTDKPSYPNSSRYVNEEFDALFEKGQVAKNQEEAYEHFAKAEQILMEDAPIVVLWYNENFKMIQSDVRNYYTNPMNIKDLTAVYFKQIDKAITKKGQ